MHMYVFFYECMYIYKLSNILKTQGCLSSNSRKVCTYQFLKTYSMTTLSPVDDRKMASKVNNFE